jgi:peptidoglycan/LPS O-acetylase OafA/YrhL
VGLTLLAMIVGLLASTILGGCDKLIECESGDFPMKCHWTFVACAVLFALGAIAALAQFALRTRESRRFAALTTVLLALGVVFLTTPWGIGLCAMETMQCHTTALVVWVCAALSVVVAVVQFAKADPEDAEKPRLED